MRRVLVVAYYFPPMGLSGVQRTAKFVKYLPDVGWQPTVLTVEPGGYFAFDRSLLREVEEAGIPIHRTASLDPTRLFGKQSTVALPAESSRRTWAVLSQWLFVPDNKLGWLPYAWARGRALLQEDAYDVIFSTAPPYSGHLIAALLSRQSGVPLVTDFRDDWVGNPRHVYPTPLHRRLHGLLERWVLGTSRRVVTINEHIREALCERNATGVKPEHVRVVSQGFDPADFEGRAAPRPEETRVLRFVHSGIFYDVQTPDYFLKAWARFLEAYAEARGRVELTFVGLVPEASMKLAEELGLASMVRWLGYVPHDEVTEHLQEADVLWMTIGRRPGAEGISSSKLFEYFGARKPVLALVPEGEAARAVRAYGAGWQVPPDDVEAMTGILSEIYAAWKEGTLPEPEEAAILQYDRRALAEQLGHLLEEAAAAT